jgi:short subunit fatty acids transporter
MNSTVKKYTALLVVAIAGILIGRYIIQPKQEVKIKEKIVYVEKFKEKKEEKKNTKTTITETMNKDGSKTTTTVITDNSTTSTQSSKDTKEKSSLSSVTKTGHSITLGMLAIKDIPNPTKPIAYGVTVVVPVFGSVSATGLVTTEKQVGIGLAISF